MRVTEALHYVWFQPVAGGLTVGILGYFLPDVMGVRYTFVDTVINGNVVLRLVILLAVLKIVATTVCYASGNAGGIFGPSLFIGATMGAAVEASRTPCSQPTPRTPAPMRSSAWARRLPASYARRLPP